MINKTGDGNNIIKMVCSIVELGTMTVQFLEKSSESVDNGGGCETDVGDKTLKQLIRLWLNQIGN